MTQQQRYEAALAYATRMHAGQVRKGGAPYITHPMAVAEIVRAWGLGEAYVLTALFHDLLEDTAAEEAEIEALAGAEVLAAVRLLTKQPGYVMADYMAAIRANPVAKAVKAADRLHNLRCAPEADEAFRRRYIAESRAWFMDMCPEIPEAVTALEATLPQS